MAKHLLRGRPPGSARHALRSEDYREQSKDRERRSFQGVVRRAMLKPQFTERVAAAEFESLEWLEDGKHPLDWNGPTGRIFTSFCGEDLNRPIIDHLERVTRRHRNRIAMTDSDTSLSFGELWDGLSGLAETITAET